MWCGLEEVPGFLVSRVFGAWAVRGEENLVLSVSGGEGDDVPDLLGNNIRGDEVEQAGAVRDSIGVDVALIGTGAVAALGGLNLHAQDGGAWVGAFGTGFLWVGIFWTEKSDVVRGGVSPGTEDGESVFGGAGHEEKLGPFAALLVVIDDVGGVVWHWVPLGLKPGYSLRVTRR